MAAAVPVWFISLAALGALYLSAACIPLLARLALCLRRPIDLRRRYGTWAVITGPTTGLGKATAMELASRGISLVLLDLDAANLQSVSDTIARTHPSIQTKTVVFDLSLVGTAAGDQAMRELRESVEGLDVGVLVNNAAVARPGALYVHEADVERLARMIRVNVMGLSEVTAAVLPGMLQRERGAIVNVGSGSTVAVPSFPLYTVYSATKRYVAHLSRCLDVEYKSKGIDVQCQVPFYVHTGMLSPAVKATLTFPAFVATAEAYARDAARWIGHGGAICVPDASQQLQWFLAGLVPDAVHDWYRLRQHLKHRAIIRKLT
ncbi:very-long-chain 3-oxoacyl-CoA reductase 1-like [Lolium rigidum]|uniref:very-long-chain 3-oxoacyl-CoA reductase 1-like n=1 Tax=Lolium rigidum TaxID=89674 RepID=UPI001F5CF003|nr:very-long-chain 3-oxoacyl-CoA reductase 1-like [Lolium rigidum]